MSYTLGSEVAVSQPCRICGEILDAAPHNHEYKIDLYAALTRIAELETCVRTLEQKLRLLGDAMRENELRDDDRQR